MAQLIDIQKVDVGPRTLTATVRVADDAPLMTSEDLEGTTRVYRLMPGIIEHVCLGDVGDTFRDVMGNTELAHLLEHATVELLAQSDMAGDISSGRTRAVGDDGRTFEIELACPDDVLVCGALSSACWMLEWAYSGGDGPEPDVEATVGGLVALVNSLPEQTEPKQGPAPVSRREAQGQHGGPMLQLVDEPVASASQPERAAVIAPSRVSEDVAAEPAPEAPPSASPEALQASADEPSPSDGQRTGRVAGRPASQDQREPASRTAERVTPLPSVTGDLPASTPVR